MTRSTGKVFKLTAVGSIRKALGDVVEAKRLGMTLRGYCFRFNVRGVV